MKRTRKILIASVLSLLLALAALPVVSAAEPAPSAFLRYDNDSQKLLRYDAATGSYVEDPAYSAVFSGSGYHFKDAGYASAHAMGFSDLTTGLVFQASGGKRLNNGGDGITVSFWINQTRTTYSSSPTAAARPAVLDNYEQLITTHNQKGDGIVLCTDGLYYFVGGTNDNRWYEYSKDFLASGATNNVFVYTKVWTLCVAVIKSDSVTVYKDGVKQYEYKGTADLLKSTGNAAAPTVRDFCSGLLEGMTGENGTFTFRGSIYPQRNTDSIRIDRLSLYDHALSAAEVTSLAAAELASALCVTVDYNDGIHSEQITAPLGGKPNLPTVTRNGYDFKCWTLDAEGKNAYNGTAFSANTTLYAQWTPREYSLNYVTNGGTLSGEPKTYTPDSETVLPIPTRPGYEFVGWFRTADLINTATKTLPHEYGNRTFYAGWKPAAVPVTYELNGGINHTANPAVLTVESGTVTLEAPVKLGFTFGGWFTSADFSGGEVRTLSAGSPSVLYARWLSGDEEETESTSASDPAGTDSADEKGCGSALVCGAALLALAAAAVLARKKKGVRLLSLVLALLMVIPSVGYVCAEDAAPAYETVRVPEEVEKKTIYILSLGNSYSADQQTYLHALAAKAGVNIVCGIAYIGGCTFRKHLEQWETKNTGYTYYENGVSKATKQTLEAILKRQKWDYVTFQCGTESQNYVIPNEPYLAELACIIHDVLPKAQLVYNLSWSDAATSTRAIFLDAYGRKQENNWKQIVEDTKDAYSTCDMPYVTPSGLAMKYAYEKYSFRMHRDGYHSSELGRYLHACVWFEFFTGLPVPEDFMPTGGTYSGGTAPTPQETEFLRGFAHKAIEDYQAAGGKMPALFAPVTYETSALRLTGTPKTEYAAGEFFDYSSFEVVAVTAAGEVKIENFTLDHTSPLTAADTSVGVTYDGLTVEVPITVK